MASYLVTKQEWDKLTGVGKEALKPLNDVLEDEELVNRENPVESLGILGSFFRIFSRVFSANLTITQEANCARPANSSTAGNYRPISRRKKRRLFTEFPGKT